MKGGKIVTVKGAVSRNSAKLGKLQNGRLRETKITALNFNGRLK